MSRRQFEKALTSSEADKEQGHPCDLSILSKFMIRCISRFLRIAFILFVKYLRIWSLFYGISSFLCRVCKFYPAPIIAKTETQTIKSHRLLVSEACSQKAD